MKFACPHCGQHLECDEPLAGSIVECPGCRASLTVPAATPAQVPTAKPEPVYEEDGSAAEGSRTIPQSAIERGGLTITQFMAKEKLKGGVQLDGTKQTATSVLKAREGQKYDIGDVVAKGGMGAIISARDLNVRRTVAMKVMLEPGQVTQEEVLRFIEEAQITGQLEHPFIVPLHELGIDAGGNVFYTMKFVRGKTLHQIIEAIRNGEVETVREYPLNRLLTVFQKVCDAVAFAHSKRVVHRDLKPENVMVGDYGEVLVMDWGLAKVLARKEGRADQGQKTLDHGPKTASRPPTTSNQQLTTDGGIDAVREGEAAEILNTMAGTVMGSPQFMAPEQAAGDIGAIDERTDVYALGAILYNVLTLHSPVSGKDLGEVLEKVTRGEIPHPLTYNTASRPRSGASVLKPETRNLEPSVLAHCPGGRVPDSLAAVAMKALAREQGKRYQSVRDLQREIEAFQGGYATGAENAGAWKQFTLFVRRNKMAAITGGLMALLLFSAMAAYTWVNQRERARAEQALADFKAEQTRRQADRKASAPQLVRSAGMAIEQKDFATAHTLAETAIEYDGNLADARLFLGLLRLQGKDYTNAVTVIGEAARLAPNDGDTRRLLEIAGAFASKKDAGNLLGELGALIHRRGLPTLALEFTKTLDEQIPLWREKIEKAWPGLGGNLKVQGPGKLTLWLPDSRVENLAPVKGMPLVLLNLQGAGVRDLSPLAGMPLEDLCLFKTRVSDLSPLNGMRLTQLNLFGTSVSDLSPLKGMPIEVLVLDSAANVADLRPIKGMPLRTLDLMRTAVSDLSPLEGMRIEDLQAAFTQVRDLTPLRGMPLRKLMLDYAPVSDLTPLRGLPLEALSLLVCKGVSDLAPLRGMPLAILGLDSTHVTDLTPLKGLPLAELSILWTPVRDLSPLRGMKTLTKLQTGWPALSGVSEAFEKGDLQQAAREAGKVVTDFDAVPAFASIRDACRELSEETIPAMTAFARSGSTGIPPIPPEAKVFGGHHYAVGRVWLSGKAARIYCERLGAHLVTITSEGEQKWVVKTFLPPPVGSAGHWMGGIMEAGRWKWVTGEPWGYATWSPGSNADDATAEGFATVLQAGINTWAAFPPVTLQTFLMEWDR